MEQIKKWLDYAKEKEILQIVITILFMMGMFFLGAQLGNIQNENGKKEKTETTSSQKVLQQEETGTLMNEVVADTRLNRAQKDALLNKTEDWGLCFGDAGTEPRANATAEEMRKYNAYYIGDKEEKVLYLTFDCGYENGNTPAILDALKKHHVSATFFVVGHYLDSAPELVKRMVEDGHTVGNHTEHHPDMSKIATKEALQKELASVENKFVDITGKEMSPYFRPPQGKYSVENLQNAKELGYHTFFWSLAYADWDQNKQPTRENALKKLTDRAHPGAVVLLHNTSKTNGEILDELLTKWEAMGYRFGTLEELLENKRNE